MKRYSKRVTTRGLNLVGALAIFAALACSLKADTNAVSAKEAQVRTDESGERLHPCGLIYKDPRQSPWLIEDKRPLGPARDLPTSVDLAAEMPPVGNQGRQGACTGFALGYNQKTHNESRYRHWDVNVPEHQFSPAFIYNQTNDGLDSGCSFGDAMQLIVTEGVAALADCPFSENDWVTWPSEQAYTNAIAFRGSRSWWFDASDETGIQRIKEQLSLRSTVVIGICVYPNFDLIEWFDNTYCVADMYGESRGGHAVTIVGYDDDRVTNDGTGAFHVVNSWGTNWGSLEGYFWMSYEAVMNRDLSYQAGYYVTSRGLYHPTMLARFRIRHMDRDRVRIKLGVGDPDSRVEWNVEFMPWRLPSGPTYPFPDHGFVFDASEGSYELPWQRAAGDVFIQCQDPVLDSARGYLESFSWTRIEPTPHGVEQTLVSPDVPTPITPQGNHWTTARIHFESERTGVSWNDLPPLPEPGMLSSTTFKRVKDGGALTFLSRDLAGCVYAFKGNNTTSFLAFDVQTNHWASRAQVPEFGSSGRRKGIKKGACLAATGDRVYATKGNGTSDFLCYVVERNEWQHLPDVPNGTRPMREGVGAAGVTIGDTDYVYLLKGSGTTEFYRYAPATNIWAAMSAAPTGNSGKKFKNGSCLAASGGYAPVIYALKGSTNELFAYDCTTNTWTARAPLPIANRDGGNKKAKDGAALACLHGYVYALKGNNTREVWCYDPDADVWTQVEDLPLGGGRKVKGGGALAASNQELFALKGNNTLEFYGALPQNPVFSHPASRPNQTASPARRPSGVVLRAAPNPVSVATTVSYSVPKAGNVCLKLYDAAGKLVTTLAKGYHSAGNYSFGVQRDLSLHRGDVGSRRTPNLGCGIYVLTLETEGYKISQKLILE